MPSQRIPAAPFGGVTSRRHAQLLIHLDESSGGGPSVKDLRLRRVVPPASAHLDSFPDCAAAAKPGSVESTPPEPVAVEDRERKPMLPRSKLVRAPASFGYRRLLPFLNEMAKNDCSNVKDTSSENTLVDESVDGSHGVADPIDSVESLVPKGDGIDQEMKNCCKEETKIVPVDLASSKPVLTRCMTRSRIVHHLGSFSYKRMLPFLIENEISSQEGDRIKFRRVLEEKQLTPDENDGLASGHHHLAVSKDSPQECNGAEDKRIEEKTLISDGDYALNGGQLQSAVSEVSPLDSSTAEVQKVTQEVLASDGDPLSSDNGELTSDGNDVLADGQRQPAVSGDFHEESNVAQVERIVEEKVTEPDDNSVLDGSHLQPTVPEVSPREEEGGTAQMQKATQKPALTSDGGKANGPTSDKGEFLAKEQRQLCDTEDLLKDNAGLAELQQCPSSESGCSDLCFGSPTKTVTVDGGADQHGPLERHDSVPSLDGPLLDVGMACRPSNPCAIGTPLSADEMSGCVMHAESGLRKVGTLRSCGTPCLEKHGLSLKKSFPFNGAACLEKRSLSPKKLSPKKGILKRHTRGCKGICMCLDCTIFRLRADRAFEFSRKQMQEADDIIGNLLEEVATLRSLSEKSPGQQGEKIEAAWQRLSRVEEVARERCRQMLMELNSHCRIPGPRVKFSQYVEEKIAASSPRSSRR